jgi:hypothetical protein
VPIKHDLPTKYPACPQKPFWQFVGPLLEFATTEGKMPPIGISGLIAR